MGWRVVEAERRGLLVAWRPFFLAARRMRLDEVPWQIDPLDFELVGQIDRARRSPLSVYVHQVTHGELNVDEDGNAYDVTTDRAGRLRAKLIFPDEAIWVTGVPHLELGAADGAAAVEPAPPRPTPGRAERSSPRPRPKPAGRPHLRLVE
jgi:hypothetical protein